MPAVPAPRLEPNQTLSGRPGAPICPWGGYRAGPVAQAPTEALIASDYANPCGDVKPHLQEGVTP